MPQRLTSVAIAELHPYRGHTEAAYSDALDALAAKGWLLRSGEEYALTAAGQAVREAAETTTDRLFYRPLMMRMTAAAVGQMRDLATQLRDALIAKAEAAPSEPA